MSLRSRLIRLAHSMPQGKDRTAMVEVLAAHEALLKLARSMPLSQALRVLGIDSSASLREAKKAFRALAMTNHPDRGGDIQKMQEINAAFMVVEEAFKRGQMGGVPKADPKAGYQDLMKTFKRLKDGDVVEVTYAPKSSSSPDTKRKFVVEQLADAADNYIYMWPARRRSNSQMAALIDYGMGRVHEQHPIYIQTTMLQNIRRVKALKVVGQM